MRKQQNLSEYNLTVSHLCWTSQLSYSFSRKKNQDSSNLDFHWVGFSPSTQNKLLEYRPLSPFLPTTFSIHCPHSTNTNPAKVTTDILLNATSRHLNRLPAMSHSDPFPYPESYSASCHEWVYLSESLVNKFSFSRKYTTPHSQTPPPKSQSYICILTYLCSLSWLTGPGMSLIKQD